MHLLPHIKPLLALAAASLTGCAALIPPSDDFSGQLVAVYPQLEMHGGTTNVVTDVLSVLPGGSIAGKAVGGIVGDGLLSKAAPTKTYTPETAVSCDADVRLSDGTELRVNANCELIRKNGYGPGSTVYMRRLKSNGRTFIIPQSVYRPPEPAKAATSGGA